MSAGRRRRSAWIGLGANLGDAQATLGAALVAIAATPRTRLLTYSSLYRSAPIDAAGPDFLNAVAQVDTGLTARELLKHLQQIERAHGRVRPFRNAPRTLDLDLLLFGDEIMQTPDLTLPHPRLRQRAFVLVPLAEVAPGLTIPGLGAIAKLLPGVAEQTIERIAGRTPSR